MGKKPQHKGCPNKGKVENPLCINCNKDEHIDSLRNCSKFPQLKPKQDEKFNSTNDKGSNNPVNRPSARPVMANVSYASVCHSKIAKEK
ncbi:hypothetical protein TNCV_315341 [Trichonephila clavipes]|nr:hypothetical protein TNCV_315341 [Trichonephila clavipes]